jgi:ribosome biogenesis protein ENP2
MHGYFLSLELYDAARVIANPFAYAEHREKMVKEKMEKMAEGRIRAKKDAGVKVNKALAEKIQREEERERKREERKKARKAQKDLEAVDEMDVDENVEADAIGDEDSGGKPSLLTDPRFTQLFEDPEFAIDQTSREYALMNPSAVAKKMNGNRPKTAVEDEEEESDKASSDGLGSGDSGSEGSVSDDSSDAGGKLYFHPIPQNVPLITFYCRT